MNLRSIANGLTQAINPNKIAIGRRFQGVTVGAGRIESPSYYPDEKITVQLQPLSYGDIKHMDGMNIQGIVKSLYINSASYYAVDRKMTKGGDLFIIDGSTWLLVDMIEQWSESGWTRVIINLRVDADE